MSYQPVSPLPTCMRVKQAWFLEEVVVPHGLVPVEGHVVARDHWPLLRRRRLGNGRHLKGGLIF